MLVEIWSDVVCPWCYIGKRRFETALARFEHAGDVEVVWRSFELDPDAPAERSGGRAEHLAAKYGTTVEQARQRLAQMDELAAAEGLDYRLEETTGGNTFDAHRVLHLAHERGIGDQVKEALLHAYFEERRPVADHAVLTDVAEGAGLDRAEVEAVLAGDRYGTEVRADEADAARLGIHGVPFFVLDRAFGVSGAQSPEFLLEALRQAWAASHPLTMVKATGGGDEACSGDACAI